MEIREALVRVTKERDALAAAMKFACCYCHAGMPKYGNVHFRPPMQFLEFGTDDTFPCCFPTVDAFAVLAAHDATLVEPLVRALEPFANRDNLKRGDWCDAHEGYTDWCGKISEFDIERACEALAQYRKGGVR